MRTMQEAHPVYRETSTGMELELEWSNDDTMAKLYITIPQPSLKARGHVLKLSAMQLDELREFLAANLT
jgi:hypothetical protein